MSKKEVNNTMISIVLGTRPEIIKMAPVIRACQKKGIDFSILHTGQHYSYEMDRIFFEELTLPMPRYNLDIGSGSHAKQTGDIMTGIEQIFLNDRPDLILVQGDTNTVMAGGLVGAKMHIPVGHVEAGLRSYDRKMPEEINRVVVDHIADYLFAPTEDSHKNLIREGIEDKKIVVTGNTVVDSLHQNREISTRKSSILKDLDIIKDFYILITAHRAENVDEISKLKSIISGIQEVGQLSNLPVIFPMHPRTRKMIQEFGINMDNISIFSPVGYLDFLELEAHARIILTDSGGIQEEACILNVPCVTLRENTERPETIEVGANTLAGTNPRIIVEKTKEMFSSKRNWVNPYGDGSAGEKIIDKCINAIHQD